MRIYRRAEFMKLPEGTVFCKGKPWAFEDLCVKGETIPNNFYARGLQWVDAHDSGEAFDRLEEMLAEGASYPLETAEMRDGCFNDEDLFLVYEKADLVSLIALFQQACDVA